MPLAFESRSHGTVAFGFFNIESDMLLLERYFFFATDFCHLVGDLADPPDGEAAGLRGEVQLIDSAANIGDLMGAIHGTRFSGFIGDVYRRFPFPQKTEDFKQNPQGAATQVEMTGLIKPYAVGTGIRLRPYSDGSAIAIGSYRFDRSEFQRLLDYVWLGGYPRWKDDTRPDDVVVMRERVLASKAPLFDGMTFSP